MQIGTISAKQFTKGVMEELYYHYREMSKAAGAMKPTESQQTNKTRVLGRAFQGPIALDKALKCLENPYQG